MSGDDIQAIKYELQEIKRNMKGSDEYGTTGFKQQIEQNRRKVNNVDNKLEDYFKQTNDSINELTRNIDKIYHIVIGASVATSAAVSIVGWLIANWTKIIG